MFADGLDQALHTRTGRIDRKLLGKVAEVGRIGHGKCLGLAGALLRRADDDAGLDRRTVFHLEGVGQLLLRYLQLFARQLPQGEARPDDVVGVLVGLDAAFLLEHFQPLRNGQLEARGQLLDFLIHLAAADRDAEAMAFGEDQKLVDHRLQHVLAVMDAALGGQFVAADCMTVDRRHDVWDRQISGGSCRRASRLGQRRFVRRGRTGRRQEIRRNLGLGRRYAPVIPRVPQAANTARPHKMTPARVFHERGAESELRDPSRNIAVPP